MTAYLARPLQRRCGQCRRVQEVRLPALYHVVVPNTGGGTRRDGGYDCRICGAENPIPAAELPQGLVALLPSRDDQRATAAAARMVEPIPAAAPPPADVPPPPPMSVPVPAIRRAPAKRAVPPSWVVGAAARATLEAAVGRAKAAADGFCTAFVRDAAGLHATIEVDDQIDPATILSWLDRTGCELLVLGGTDADGARWKAVFHPLAGAATLARDPADPGDAQPGRQSSITP